MASFEHKIVQYLTEAHASEVALVNVLTEQVAMTPRGPYRTALERHHKETRDHAQRIQKRLGEIDAGSHPLQLVTGLAQTMLEQGLALAKAPLDMLRGHGGEEKVLKNAKDTAATEAVEIATYVSLEQLAREAGDQETAKLAASIRRDEERMLDSVLKEIPKLTTAAYKATVEGNGSYDVTKTGAAEAVREAGKTARRTTQRTARSASTRARTTGKQAEQRATRSARQARKVPGVTRAEGEAKGAVASQSDLPIANYDKLNADEVTSKLAELSQVDLGKVDAYERKNQSRSTVLERIGSLRGDEPWAGYDELNVDEVQTALSGADEDRVRKVREYERAHKQRAGVLERTERELSGSAS
jgi:ferritin-like metal-binding protein YciE